MNAKMFGQTRPLSILAIILLATAIQLATGAYQSYGSGTSSSGSSSSVTTTTTTTTTISNGLIRLRANKLTRRPDSCREQLPRKSDDLPVLVITGRVKDVYLAGSTDSLTTAPLGTSGPAIAANAGAGAAGGVESINRALVNIGRVIRGDQQLVGTDILVSGFNSSTSAPCPNYVKPNDTLILLLEQELPGTDGRRYNIQGGNLLAMNLNNLERVNALVADEAHKRRAHIEDILCESHYCPFGRCVVLSEHPPELTCKCPDSCPPPPTPVCGSDNVTYTNECHLIKEGCRLKRPLFVTKLSSC